LGIFYKSSMEVTSQYKPAVDAIAMQKIIVPTAWYAHKVKTNSNIIYQCSSK
jgi:hypothetical protein